MYIQNVFGAFSFTLLGVRIVKAEINGSNLVITLPLTQKDPPLSKSQKTHVVASTRGNVKTNLEVEGRTITIGVNAYIPLAA